MDWKDKKFVTFLATDITGKDIKRTALLDEKTNQIVAFEFKDNEIIDFKRLRNKKIILYGRLFSIRNNLKIGKELCREKRATYSKIRNR